MTRDIVCPACQISKLRPGPLSVHCFGCGVTMSRELFETLRRIRTLPDALGEHACECGHPEMRLLPDGVSLCPSCHAEVTPHYVR